MESKGEREGAKDKETTLTVGLAEPRVDESDESYHKSTEEERTPQGSPPTSDLGGEEGDGEEDGSGSGKRAIYTGDKPPPHRALTRRKSANRGRGSKGKSVLRRNSNELSPTTVLSETNARGKLDASRPAIFTFSPGGTVSKKAGPSPTAIGTGDIIPGLASILTVCFSSEIL